MSYITTTYYYTVTVGSGAYPSPLTIIASGAVEPTGIGATGVYSGLAGNSVANYGIIDGGAGIGELPGGFGVDLSAGTLINSATAFINGGSGFYNGGDGVYLHGGTLTNYGTIDGGSVDHVFGSISGAGVDLSAGTLINNGYINAGSNTFFGAFAADLSGGTLINNGSIVGAGGHYDYGGGVYLNGGALTTSGLISGGVSGGPSGNGGLALQFGSAASTMTVDPGATFQGAIDGFAPGDTIDITGLTPAQVASYFNPVSYTLTTADEGTLQFAARYIGEYFTFNADLSGTGTDITLATGSGISTILPSTVTLGSTYDASPLTITATGGVYPGTGGATGVISNISGNSLTNHGAIQGGAGYYGGGSGGVGVNFTKAGMLTNTGSITGGTGGGSYSASGGQGGASVSLFVATLTNTGSITGGTGGSGVGGGAGGVGVTLSSGATLTNSGSITGGMGGGVDPGYTGTGGQGGAGMFLNGPTLTTSGSISGGSGGSGTVNGAAGDAVQFGLVTSTLVVEPGAVFNGQVAANASVHDVLKLSGIQGVGSAITLGKQFTGFSVLDFASGAAWTADVSMGAASSTPGLTINGFTTSDTIDVAKLTPTQVAGDFNSSTHVLTTGSDGTLDFTNSFSGEYALFSSDGSGGTDITLVKGSGISTTRASTVNLGSAQPSPLTITNTGVVVPTAAGATGVLSDISGNSLTNAGAIDGGAGSNGTTGGEGGVGLNFEKGATVTNTGSITGGTGGTSSSAGAGGGGGIGVILDGGTLTNTGRITGGAGGGGSVGGGNPAEGAFLNGGTLITSGTISGGTGGSGGYPPLTGDAVLFGSIASTLTVDSGAVFNGAIGGFGFNDTIDMTNLTPTQVAGDFNSNTDVLSTASDGTLHFSGAFPDESFVFSSDGGAGTDITLSSGPGISTTFTGTVTMGSAAFPSPLTITTTGVVAPTVAGATAVLSDISGNSLTNAGAIDGGAGSNGTTGGHGGLGLNFEKGGAVTNTGSINGGHGGSASGAGAGGTGGVGADLFAGTLTNTGSITGGGGGNGTVGNGQPSPGVYLDGGTLISSGAVSGGSGGGGGYPPLSGDAVLFGSIASTLTVDPGAVFTGAIGAFGLNDTIDMTNLTPTQVAGDFNSSTHVLTTGSDGTLDFTNSFSGEYALFSSDGSGGTDITLVKGSGISTTRASTVNLGSAQPSPLTITNTGVVVPTAAGATGVLSDISGNSLTNAGAIDGGAGSNGTTGGEGGVGLNFEKGATVTNTGSITGGTGGTSSSAGAGGGGGIGVILDGGTLTNTGRITGGAGGGGSVGGGNPAEGAFLNGGTLITSGTISGGTGGSGGYPPLTGDAVLFGSIASTLTVDSGAVFNGAIGGFGFNDTIDMTNLTPTQVAGDFNSNTDVLSTASDGTLHFSGAFPDESFVFSSDGGAGTDITLSSGPGISTTFTGTVTMGSAAFPSPLTITTTGVVAPTVAGATAVLSDISGNSLTNAGAIDGGAGSNGTTGGHGGLGLNFEKGGAVTNTGSINGGHGGSASGAGAGGTGGVGADLFAGTLTNTGSITGGGGGNGTVGNGQPSPGVYLDGGTLISSGAVSGGSGGGGGYPPLSGDAVLFGSIASTLTVDPGAVFNGQVVATASVHDVLELSGTQSTGTAITLGTQFTHFSTLDFAPAAAWTVDAGMHAAPSGGLAINGFTTSDTIDITNLTPTQVEADFTSDVITTASDGTLTFNGVSGDTFVFTAKGAGTDVTVQPSPAATLAAAGHDLTNFVGDEHRALMGGQFTLGARSFGSAPTLHTDPALVAGSVHSLSADALSDHGLAHALSVGSHA